MIIMTYLYVILTILIISFLFVLSGLKIYNYSILDSKNHSFAFKFGISYFLGMGLFLTIWRLLAFLVESASLSLKLSFLFIILVCLLQKGTKEDVKQIISGIKHKNYLIFIFSCILIFEFLLWLNSFKDVYTHFGSGHSGRYVNIAQYIIDFNRIPTIGQNYGQSMLASILMFIDLNSPFLVLNIWLSTSIFFLCISIYEFLKILKISNKMSIAGTFIVMFGNTALSLTHVLVIDSGSPFIMNVYTDSIFSIATILLFFIWFNSISICIDTTKKLILTSLPILFIFGISWNISAPQNIVVSLSLLAILIGCIDIFNKKYIIKNNRILILGFFIIVLFSLFGSTQGGMLSSKILRDDIKLPGLMEANTSNLFVRPELQHFYGLGGVWKSGSYDILKVNFQNKTFPLEINNLIFKSESNLWSSIRVTFFPIIGIIILRYLIKNNKYNYKDNEHNEIKTILLFSIITFIIGFLIAFLINIYKWELARFLIPGYFFGMMSLVLVINFFQTKLKSNTNKYAFMLILIFIITIGPVIDSLFMIITNVLNLNEGYTFLERIRMLAELHGIIY